LSAVEGWLEAIEVESHREGASKKVQHLSFGTFEEDFPRFAARLEELGVAEADALATQLQLLVDGSIALDLVRDDPAMARAAKEAARVLLVNAGVEV